MVLHDHRVPRPWERAALAGLASLAVHAAVAAGLCLAPAATTFVVFGGLLLAAFTA